MRARFFILGSIFFAAVGAYAAPAITNGTPGNSYLSVPSGPSPSFGTLYSFDALTPNSMFNSAQYSAQGVTISSPDGLMVLPDSSQSSPNYLFDNSANGSANIKIATGATNQLGIGLADSDGVAITLQALNASGTGFGSLFSVTLPAAGLNPFNGYFVISDAAADIYGMQILQTTGNANFAGLGIDDLQVASTATPEPASVALLGAGVVLIAMTRLRKHA